MEIDCQNFVIITASINHFINGCQSKAPGFTFMVCLKQAFLYVWWWLMNLNNASISEADQYLLVKVINSFGMRTVAQINSLFLSALTSLSGENDKLTIASSGNKFAVFMCKRCNLTIMDAFYFFLKLIGRIPDINRAISTSCVAVPFSIKNSTCEVSNATLVSKNSLLREFFRGISRIPELNFFKTNGSESEIILLLWPCDINY